MKRLISTLTLALIATNTALAGDLNPPVEPVGPTFKTLGEVEPRIAINATNTPGDADSMFRITAPGSYYLTGNIQGVSGKSGIEIATNNVTIDLNGFVMLGSVGTLAGIAAPSRDGISVYNGAVRGWGTKGVDCFGGDDNSAQDLKLEFNGNIGLDIGLGARVDRVVAQGNSTGIRAASFSIITGSIAIANGVGMSIGAHSIARDCHATENSSDGFNDVATGSTFENCVAMSNGGDGFDVSSHARIERCAARFNGFHGILCGSESRIVGNMCELNGQSGAGAGAGIYGGAAVTRCHIEGNTITSCDFGIKIDGTSNLIIGNRCSINTLNYEIVANNRIGAITVMATSSASGNSGGSTGTADTMSNLVY
ncbi:MAG: right-handed parallel beta-helix repeat-containing protein [Phycisphaerae bacterium]